MAHQYIISVNSTLGTYTSIRWNDFDTVEQIKQSIFKDVLYRYDISTETKDCILTKDDKVLQNDKYFKEYIDINDSSHRSKLDVFAIRRNIYNNIDKEINVTCYCYRCNCSMLIPLTQ